VIFTIKAFWLFAVVYHGSAMSPDLSNGDIVLCSRTAEIERCDKIYFVENDTVSGTIVRLLAKAGDTLQIFEGRVFVNKLEYIVTNTTERYRIISRIPLKKDSLRLLPLNNNGFYQAEMTQAEATRISKLPHLRIKSKYFEKNINQRNIFPHSYRYAWNSSFFGPLIIPRKNSSIKITVENYRLYSEVIKKYENHNIEIIKGKIYIDEKISTNYTFQNNYFFVLNDNRTNTHDSREYGFLPESTIKGKVIALIYDANSKRSFDIIGEDIFDFSEQ